MKHEPCLLILRKGSRPSKPSAWGNFSTSPAWSVKTTVWCGAVSAFLWVNRSLILQLSRGRNLHSWLCHTPWQPLQNHLSGHLGGWAMPWLAEEMLDGQHQRVDISAHARTGHKGLLQKRLEEDLCWIVPHVPQSVQGLTWTEMTVYILKLKVVFLRNGNIGLCPTSRSFAKNDDLWKFIWRLWLRSHLFKWWPEGKKADTELANGKTVDCMLLKTILWSLFHSPCRICFFWLQSI